jgi:hypothetical protein
MLQNSRVRRNERLGPALDKGIAPLKKIMKKLTGTSNKQIGRLFGGLSYFAVVF